MEPHKTVEILPVNDIIKEQVAKVESNDGDQIGDPSFREVRRRARAPNNATAPIGAKLGGCGMNRLIQASTITKTIAPKRRLSFCIF